ncbi:nucleotidyltransferase family protein [Halomonas binhaiensis]|uniref:Nucleotidyltransferase family protein n=1 Tax=Halomonas binhaiensis TaxID=2562282 RepID=A0A5C1NP08_9GAMM|nr:nucleotidyltransferase family protein [Halomonas binhaiensis]
MLPDTAIAIVLAAGFSRRFGPEDKRISQLANGQALLAASVARACEAFEQVFVVLREEDNPAVLGIPESVAVLRAPRALLGLGASLGDAIAAIRCDPSMAKVNAAAILLGDMPDIASSTLKALCRQSAPDYIIRPVFLSSHSMLPGHPVLFGRDFFNELERLDGDEGGKEIIQRHRDACRQIHVADPGVCRDIDTPQALERWRAMDRHKMTGNHDL